MGAGALCWVRATAPRPILLAFPTKALGSFSPPHPFFLSKPGGLVRGAARQLRPGYRGKAVFWRSRVARQARGARPELARQSAGGGSGGAPRGEQGQAGGAEVKGKAWVPGCEGRGLQALFGPGPGKRLGARGGGREAGQGGTKGGDRWGGPGAWPTGSRWAGTGALLEEEQHRGGGLRALTGRPPPGPGER